MILDAEEAMASKFGIPIDRYFEIGNRLETIFEGRSIHDAPALIKQEMEEHYYTPIEAAAFGFLIGTITGRTLYEK